MKQPDLVYCIYQCPSCMHCISVFGPLPYAPHCGCFPLSVFKMECYTKEKDRKAAVQRFQEQRLYREIKRVRQQDKKAKAKR